MTAGHAMSETRCGGCQHDLSRHVGIVSTQPGKVYCLDCVGVPDICWMLACPDCGAPCAPGGLHICPMRGAVRVPDFHPASPAPLDETNPLVRLMVAEADEPAPPFAAPRDETPTPPARTWVCTKCNRTVEASTLKGATRLHDLLSPVCPYSPNWLQPAAPLLPEAVGETDGEDAKLGRALREALATLDRLGDTLEIDPIGRTVDVWLNTEHSATSTENDATRALSALLHSSAPQTRETT